MMMTPPAKWCWIRTIPKLAQKHALIAWAPCCAGIGSPLCQQVLHFNKNTKTRRYSQNFKRFMINVYLSIDPQVHGHVFSKYNFVANDFMLSITRMARDPILFKRVQKKRSCYSQEWNLACWPCIGIGPVWIIIGLDSSGRDFPKCWRFTLWRSNRESFAAFYVTNSSLRSPSFDIWGTYGMLAIVLAVSQLGLRTFSRERFRGRAYLGKLMIKFSIF